jgi:hypothetical protein
MRVVVFSLVSLLFATTLSAQPSPCAPPSGTPLGFDPYNPSDLAIVRSYGGAVMSQVPLATLLQLDPYVPTEAALLRQVGGGLPFWAYSGYGWYPPVVPSPPCKPAPTSSSTQPVSPVAAAPPTTVRELLAKVERRTSATVAAVPTSRPRAASARPGRGIIVHHDGREWVSAGPAVNFSETAFVRIGEQAGSPIFRESRGDRALIFIPTAPGMVAPFRASR